MNKIQFYSKKCPTPADANEDGFVLAWDTEQKMWVPRFYFDSPNHPEWSKEERASIRKRYPKWKPLDKYDSTKRSLDPATAKDVLSEGRMYFLRTPCTQRGMFNGYAVYVAPISIETDRRYAHNDSFAFFAVYPTSTGCNQWRGNVVHANPSSIFETQKELTELNSIMFPTSPLYTYFIREKHEKEK